MKRIYTVTVPDPGYDFEPGVAVVAICPDDAWQRAGGLQPLDDVEMSDARIKLLEDPVLDAWALEHEPGTEPPLVMLRPHGWRKADETTCTSCDMAACGLPEHEVCHWCDRCPSCADEEREAYPDDYDRCEECGR